MSPEPDGLKRDQYGRPLILPPGGTRKVPYTRISTLARTLSDDTGLTMWKMRQTAVGAALRPDLLALVQSAHGHGDTKAIDRAVSDMMDAAGGSKAANIGTAVHSFLELVDLGHTPLLPPEYRADIEAYLEAMSGLRILAMERFVVVDDLEAAGTFDRLVMLPDGRVVVADIKTGSSVDRYPLPTAVQIALYSRGSVYNPGFDQPRRGSLIKAGVDQDVGLLIHLPAGKGRCTLHLVDLQVGWEAARMAVKARKMNKDRTIATPYEEEN